MGEDERFVKPGAHIILVGSYTPDMHEVSQELLSRTGSPDGRVKMNVVVDSRAACLKEAGELIGAEAEGDHLVEIGELLKLGQDGKWMEDEGRMGSLVRERNGEISVFKSVGVGVQDVAIAALVLGKAEGMGLGVLVEDYDV
jgi:ornithine cyclodeaminase/alanine dehydrogenase-like protein (mu-crystallin family)